jgi:hypothetical protein
MKRLDIIENFYLNILRLTILVVATLFLVGAIISLVIAVPKFLPAPASGRAETQVTGTSLSDYRNEHRAAGSSDAETASADAAPTTEKIDSRIVTASRNLRAWGARTGQDFDLSALEKVLTAKQQSLSEKLQGDYADSLVSFSREVLASGEPSDDINQLIEWHLAKFTSAQAAAAEAEQARAIKAATSRQDALLLAEASAAAFGLFLFLLFVFVLVKIERNLRIVLVQNAEGTDRSARASI